MGDHICQYYNDCPERTLELGIYCKTHLHVKCGYFLQQYFSDKYISQHETGLKQALDEYDQWELNHRKINGHDIAIEAEEE